MRELYFIGIDIVEETKLIVDTTNTLTTGGMEDNEIKAYNLGVANTLSALRAILHVDDNHECVLNIDGMEIPTEFVFDDLETYLLDN